MKILRRAPNSEASPSEGAGEAGGATETLERPLLVREPVRVRACRVGEAGARSSHPGDPPKGVSG